MSDVWLQGFNDGYDEGREQGQHEVRNILSDLIAELRGMAEPSDLLTEWIGPSLEQAEQRLQELDTPPNSANERINLGGAR